MSKQLINFKIDPNLDRMWKLIGLTNEARETSIMQLYNALAATYQDFMDNVSQTCEEMRKELFDLQEQFKRTKKVYDDQETVLPIKPNLSYSAQIKLTQKAIDEINEKYEPRVHEFEMVFEKLKGYFDKLGIPEDDREDFGEIGDKDLTENRLNLFHDRLKAVKAEYQQRVNIVKSMHDALVDLEEELEENLPDNVIQIFHDELYDNESVQILVNTQNELQKLKDERISQIEDLSKQINYYYDILGIDKSDQIAIETAPTAKNVKDLQNELQFLLETSEERFPIVIKELNRSITQLCDELYIPARQRPHYNGSDIERQAVYLKNELEKLKQRQIMNRPILDVFLKLESQKEILNTTYPTVTSKHIGSAKKSLEQERLKRAAREQIPKLEEKLYNMLVDYRKQNGQDFYFNDVKVIDTLDPDKFSEEAKKAAAGKKLLFQKMNESMLTGTPFQSRSTKTPNRGMTSRLSTYTLSPFK